MKKYLLLSTVALSFLGGSNAVANEPPLIPDCYVDGQSQSEFHDCVRRNAGAGGVVLAPRSVSNQAAADENESWQVSGDDQSPPAGMREREQRKVAASSRASDPYARLSTPSRDAYGPPSDWEASGESSDMDGPDWGPPRDDGDGSPEFGPPPGGDWDDSPMPPPGGSDY